MYKENGRERPADPKETAHLKGKVFECQECAQNVRVGWPNRSVHNGGGGGAGTSANLPAKGDLLWYYKVQIEKSLRN